MNVKGIARLSQGKGTVKPGRSTAKLRSFPRLNHNLRVERAEVRGVKRTR